MEETINKIMQEHPEYKYDTSGQGFTSREAHALESIAKSLKEIKEILKARLR